MLPASVTVLPEKLSRAGFPPHVPLTIFANSASSSALEIVNSVALRFLVYHLVLGVPDANALSRHPVKNNTTAVTAMAGTKYFLMLKTTSFLFVSGWLLIQRA
jgi:hypothetical protein